MQKCPCECDHWMHLAQGFQGIVSMMGTLNHNNIEASDAAVRKMEEHLALLKAQIETQKQKKVAHGVRSDHDH